MQRRTWLGLGCIAASVALAVVWTVLGDLWNIFSGALLLAGIVLLVSGMRFWHGLVPDLPAMPDLMRRPRPDQRWCTRCGRPTPRRGPCPTCGVAASRERRKLRRLQRKQGATAQKEKT